jgi:hypothetical protein
MRLRPHLIGAAVLVAAAAGPAPASAQTGDPKQGSPSGVIYEIPLDNARRDAAPSGGGSGKGGSSGGTTTASGGGLTSPIRSENGFGSSATVPGVKASAAKGSGKSGSGSSKSGSGAKAPVMTSPAESLGPPQAASISATPSRSRAYLLLALALAVAAGIGVAGRYVARRR